MNENGNRAGRPNRQRRQNNINNNNRQNNQNLREQAIENANRNNRNNNNNRQPYEGRISLRRVEELLVKEPDEIVLLITDVRFGLRNYLNADRMGDELMLKFIDLLRKAFTCNSMKTKLNSLIDQLVDSNFMKQLVYNFLERQNKLFMKNVLELCKTFNFQSPIVSEKLGPIRDRLELLILLRMRDQELINEWQDFLTIEEESKRQRKAYRNRTFNNILKQDDLDPPNDFTQMSIVPTLYDILNDQELFLRKNITNGAYKSVHHYLDVQFRLLREDFLYPLRNGVRELKTIVGQSKSNKTFRTNDGQLSREVLRKIKRIESLNVYFDVRMDSCVTTDFGIMYGMRLDMEKCKSINWENSKRLIFGSLVCFSSDFFVNDCIIGIICERDEKKFKENGTIYVRFDQSNNLIDMNSNIPIFNESYIMLETSAFFEAYRHVLEALVSFQRHGDNEFPFKENLIDCQNSNIPLPNYMRNTSVDFR
jgi:hypothetical protein